MCLFFAMFSLFAVTKMYILHFGQDWRGICAIMPAILDKTTFFCINSRSLFGFEELGGFLSDCRCVFMWGLRGLKNTDSLSLPARLYAGPQRQNNTSPHIVFPRGHSINLEEWKYVRHRPTCWSCLPRNLIRHKPNGWTAIKMVFTSPS